VKIHANIYYISPSYISPCQLQACYVSMLAFQLCSHMLYQLANVSVTASELSTAANYVHNWSYCVDVGGWVLSLSI